MFFKKAPLFSKKTSALSFCIFCGSKMGAYEKHAPEVERFARTISEQGYRIIFGAGQQGFMGKIYKGATKASKHYITGVPMFSFLHEIEDKEKFNRLYLAKTLGKRKDLFVKLADAFIVFPGSFGTLDEYFHVLLLNAYKMIDKPIILVNMDGYFDLLEKLTFLPIERQFSRPTQLKNVFSVSSVEDILPCFFQRPEQFCLYNKYLTQHK